ncbi:MAG TPA: dTDP-4-dehydrorhamnose reductase [Terriglobales bacterium]|nr:dTDP-4-dehydrorhamnose reductase [Terriglobales bacterium]
MKISLFGATGILGQALMRQWTDDSVAGFSSKDADIRDREQVIAVLKDTKPDWTVLTAAYTDVDGCETNRELAFDVNTRGAANVAEAAKQFGSRLLFISSDYVFDGKKTTPYETDDPVAPRSVYGQSKAEAEKEIPRILPDACIVRTSWLFGVGGKCFPDTILKLAAKRPEIKVVADQRGCPTHAEDLATAIIQLCRGNATGMVHATNKGDCSWFDFAKEIVSGGGMNTIVLPTTSDKFVRPAPRPAYSVLSHASLDKYGIVMPNWKTALRNYLAQRDSLIAR